jgi:DNA-binding transcriptional ArsR family regulator
VAADRGPADGRRVDADVDADIDLVFAALADPTRRRLLDQLARHGPLSATELAGGYPMSRQAVAKHLGALAGAGLLEGERRGRAVRYRVDPDSIESVRTWLDEVGGRWSERLEALRAQLTDP